MKRAPADSAEVVDAFRQRGFEFIGRTEGGRLVVRGALRTSGARHACEVELDAHLFELPTVRLLERPACLSPVAPHLSSDGYLCYIAKGTIVLDIFDPVGQSLACLERAEKVLDQVLAGGFVEDLEEEFYAYWQGQPCLLDLSYRGLGRQDALVVNVGSTPRFVVTDDRARTRAKLDALGWTIAEDLTMVVYRVRTRSKPRPHAGAWPPRTMAELLAWQARLDPNCRKKIAARIEKAVAIGAPGAAILVESPLMTYGFVVWIKRAPLPSGMRRAPKPFIQGLEVAPVSVVRIDDGYMAERNIPGKRTLAGKRLALVGCGTIGGYMAEMLLKAGAGTMGGELTLVDFETLGPQNVGRHRLGFPYLFSNKARGLAAELVRMAPGARVRALPVDAREARLGDVDLLIDASGEEALGHWLCARYLGEVPMLSAWIEGPGTAVRALLRADRSHACYRCLFEWNRKGHLGSIVGGVPTLLAGQGCEGLYVPFPASVSVQAAALGAEMVLAWANDVTSPALRTKLVDSAFELATADCDPPRVEDCPACPS